MDINARRKQLHLTLKEVADYVKKQKEEAGEKVAVSVPAEEAAPAEEAKAEETAAE